MKLSTLISNITLKKNSFEKKEIQQMFNENIRIMNEDYLNKRDFEKAQVKQNEANEFYKKFNQKHWRQAIIESWH